MAERYLLPEDVSAEHAKQVLDFLNQAASAQVIAEAVEFPHELDVGVRVGQRIITRRNELNGFRTLDQLYAVPYVGPERFTEIVVSLSGARPPRGDSGVAQSELDELRRSVDAIRSLLHPTIQARLWSLQPTIWLGQSATVLVQLNDAGGRALVDQPITVATSWGELTATNNLQIISNNVVVARTSDAGLVELRLRVRFQAPLSNAQRLALELAAADLPLKAPWPTAAGAQLSDLVERYRAPGSDDLREAIDAAFREYGASVELAQHRGQALAQWPLLPVSVVCFVHDEDDERGHRHLALATHTVTVRNWLPAFLATFEHDVAGDKGLDRELRRAPRDQADSKVFLNDVFISVQSFLNTERGELGQSIRTRAAQDQMQQFLQSDVTGLPAEAQIAAATGVHEASRTIGEGGLTLFKAVDSTRRNTIATFDLSTGLLATRLGALETTAVTTQQFDALRTEILGQIQVDLTAGMLDLQAAFDTQIQQVANTQLQLSQQITQLEASQTLLSQQVSLKADVSTVNALAASNTTLRRDLDAVSATTTSLRTDVNSLSTSVTGLNTRITRDLTTLGTRVDGIDTRLGRR